MKQRRAKIVATIGPASEDKSTLQQLVSAGMDVARLNFSHSTYAVCEDVIRDLREITHRLGQPLMILQDLQGPKIRTGDIEGGLTLQQDEIVTLTTQPAKGHDGLIPVDFEALPQHVSPGNTILLDDGNLELVATGVAETTVEAKVVVGGELTSHKGINLPGVRLNIPGFTEKDEHDLAFGLEKGVDAVAVSFVRSAEDVARVRRAISRLAPEKVNTPIIAKLERSEALDNLDEIIEAADGVMVARGDLGVEMPPESVPIAQKRIIDAANHSGKVVITATQMLDSMVNSPRPTRAESSDVANAVFDGTDAVMLSNETAVGKYPVKAVQMMDSIVREAEAHLSEWGHWHGSTPVQTQDSAISITLAARELAHSLDVAAIVVYTSSGRTARLMSKAYPRVPILGFTPWERTYNRMALYWGVIPYVVPEAKNLEDMLDHLDAAMIASTPIKPGQKVVVISGLPVGTRRPPNFTLVYTCGEEV